MTPIAGLDGGQRQRIAGLLGKCVVRIQAGGATGTGFFIAPGEVLTCRHVVAPAVARGSAISVQRLPSGSEDLPPLGATIRVFPEADWPDIAILAVPGATDAPCVPLDPERVLDDTPLMTAGFPAKALLGFQVHSFTAGYPARGEGPVRELRIQGDMVTGGMSGSPIVSLQSGLVVGILRIGKGSNAPLGGFGTMLADVTGQVPRLGSLAGSPESGVGEWLGILGPIRLKELGRDRNTGARLGQIPVLPRIDLTVEQAPRTPGKWQIGVTRARASEVRVSRKAADLGDGVIHAVDGWSRRRTFQRLDEVRILGDVLDRALIPDAARTAMKDEMTAPPLLLRVCMDNAGGLSQLPWEYACGEGAEPLSVNRDIAFARFVPAPGDPPAPKDRLRVLAVIEMPDDATLLFREYPDEDGRTIEPSVDEFQRSIREVLLDNDLVFLDFASRESSLALKNKLSDGWDIVHYVGFAWQAEGDEPVISLGGGKQLRSVSISELGEDYLALSRCAVFVAEFHQLPFGGLVPPSDLSAFSSLLKDDLHAIVVTRHPADVVDLRRFNEGFYERIANGDIVELAVQSGRRAVLNGRRPRRDVTAFGSFTVTTRQAGEVRLLKPRTSLLGIGRQAGPQEGAAAERAALLHGRDTAAAVTGE
jgi:hypothetical protein